jgi:hypothetical protein
VTTDLSRLAGMFVISGNTAFTYRNKPVDTRQIGRELGVRYVLAGSVRRSGNRVRVTAQLIDAETDAHLWAERFDRDTSDLFALQDEITSRIAIALNLELVIAEAARPTEKPDALDYIFRARAAGWKPPSRDKYTEQIRLLERALALDPQSVEVQSRLAIALMSRVVSGMADSVAADIARAAQPPGALRQRAGVARAATIRGSHSRVRGGDRVQSQLGGRITPSCPVQALRRVDRGDDPARGASHPPQPA